MVVFLTNFINFRIKNADVSKIYADKGRFYYIFVNYISTGTSMPNISLVALIVLELTRGGSFYPPPTIQRP